LGQKADDMDVRATAIPDVKIITPRKFGDERGYFSEVYNRRALREAGIDLEFVQDNHSLSAQKGTIRGLHFQKPPMAQAKLVRVTRGAALDVAVDIRRGSATYGKHVAVELSAANWQQLFVPAGFAHGFCTLEPDTEVMYKVSAYYSAEHDAGIAWDDPALAIEWPLAKKKAVVSEKDGRWPTLAEVGSVF
jgi:dTDP-4-dehydrorhamnose 3,5-epimerase